MDLSKVHKHLLVKNIDLFAVLSIPSVRLTNKYQAMSITIYNYNLINVTLLSLSRFTTLNRPLPNIGIYLDAYCNDLERI